MALNIAKEIEIDCKGDRDRKFQHRWRYINLSETYSSELSISDNTISGTLDIGESQARCAYY